MDWVISTAISLMPQTRSAFLGSFPTCASCDLQAFELRVSCPLCKTGTTKPTTQFIRVEKAIRKCHGLIKRPVAGVTTQLILWHFSISRARESPVKLLFPGITFTTTATMSTCDFPTSSSSLYWRSKLTRKVLLKALVAQPKFLVAN